MRLSKIKSHAKLNLALNIVGKINNLHIIESIIAFVILHDEIYINKINSNNHEISFRGKFSKNIKKTNTVSELLKILDRKKLLKNIKYKIIINKNIPIKSGLGGGSMNAANILKFFLRKKIIQITSQEVSNISKLIGSDVILGLHSTNSIINSKNQVKRFSDYKKFYVLIVKPDFGCSTREIYSKVKEFTKPKFNNPNKKMFNFKYLKKMSNSLEPIAISKYSKLNEIKSFLVKSVTSDFVRMTGSGSAIVAYFRSKKRCENAKKQFRKKYKKYWCMVSKTI
tara:strand:- start:45 stop:890 length:846 start_codon:yes stop_codon:yes gene_type:complete